jgi:hypothetical protein
LGRRLHLRALALALLTLVAAARAPGTERPALAVSWIPIEPGNRWTYQLERQQTRSLNGVVGRIDRLRGELHEEITGPVAKFGEGAFELRETVRGRVEGAAGQHVEVKRSVVAQSGPGYAVMAEEVANDLLSLRGLARFLPPLEQLPPRIQPGVAWHVGLAHYDGMFVDIHGEILGVEPLETPAGRFEGCLKVRYRARVWGEIRVFGTTAPIERGSYISTEWFALGVGRVRADEATVARLRLAGGASLDLDQRMLYSLKSTTFPASPPASPANPEPAR